MAILNLKAWQDGTRLGRAVLGHLYFCRITVTVREKCDWKLFRVTAQKRLLFGLICMELEAVIIPIIAKRDRGALVAVHQPSCVDAVFLLTFGSP